MVKNYILPTRVPEILSKIKRERYPDKDYTNAFVLGKIIDDADVEECRAHSVDDELFQKGNDDIVSSTFNLRQISVEKVRSMADSLNTTEDLVISLLILSADDCQNGGGTSTGSYDTLRRICPSAENLYHYLVDEYMYSRRWQSDIAATLGITKREVSRLTRTLGIERHKKVRSVSIGDFKTSHYVAELYN